MGTPNKRVNLRCNNDILAVGSIDISFSSSVVSLGLREVWMYRSIDV